jgi:hypothetical protein
MGVVLLLFNISRHRRLIKLTTRLRLRHALAENLHCFRIATWIYGAIKRLFYRAQESEHLSNLTNPDTLQRFLDTTVPAFPRQ